jgi:hypothetical protein
VAAGYAGDEAYLLISPKMVSPCGEHGLALQDHSDGLIGVDATAGSGACPATIRTVFSGNQDG